MANVCRGLLQVRWQPQLQIARFKSKIRITKPKPPHFERALLERICKPYLIKEKKIRHIPNFLECPGPIEVKNEVVHPMETALAKEALNWFKNSKLIAFFHRNYMDDDEKFKAQLVLKKGNIRFLVYSNKVLKLAVTGSIYEPATVLFTNYNVIGVSQEDDIHKLMETAKNTPKLNLMAAIVNNRFLSYSQLEYYGQFKSLDEVRAKLVAELSLVSQNLVRNISHHPNNLVQLLKQHQEVNKKS